MPETFIQGLRDVVNLRRLWDVALQVTGGTITGSLTVQGDLIADDTIRAPDEESLVGISGGSTLSTGANILAYGQSHATLAGDMFFRSDTSSFMWRDHSASTTYHYGDATFDGGVLHVDSTNDRVGIGTATPSSDLDVNGDVACTTISASASKSGITDWDSMTSPGNYQVGNGQTNQPESGYNWAVQVLQNSNVNNITQIASRMASTNPAIWVRTRSGGTWSSWYCLFEATTFFIDETNNRVGILNTSPAVELDVNGDVNIDGAGGTTAAVVTLAGNDIGGYEVSIADDAVASLTPPRNGGFLSITCAGTSTTPQPQFSGMMWYDVGTSLNISEFTLAGVGGNLDTSTSDVTGTTGTDGNVTVAVQSGVIKVENRSGSNRTFQFTFT